MLIISYYLPTDRITRSLHSTSPSQANCETPTSDYFSRPSSSLSVDVESLQENMSVSDVDSISQILRFDFVILLNIQLISVNSKDMSNLIG